MILTANDVLERGLMIARLTEHEQEGLGAEKCRELFRSMYGSPPEVCAQMWQDLCNTDIPSAKIHQSEKNNKGFKLFMMAQYELWVYPKNRFLLQMQFYPVGEKDTYGHNLWKWISKICGLLVEKIKWLERFSDPDAEVFIVTVDGIDCRCWEKRNHPTMPFDKKAHSHKFSHAAYKYEIAVAVYSDHIVWVNGPFKGGKHDLTIFRQGKDGEGSLLDKIPDGKMGMADRGYKTGIDAEILKIAFKRNDDPIALKRHKGRGTCRQETINARIKSFKCISDTFSHTEQQHEWAFKAVCVIVQYHLDMGVAVLYDM